MIIGYDILETIIGSNIHAVIILLQQFHLTIHSCHKQSFNTFRLTLIRLKNICAIIIVIDY